MSLLLIYIIIGYFVSSYMVWKYRTDGTTDKKYELYFAVFGSLIWPIQLIKYWIDKKN